MSRQLDLIGVNHRTAPVEVREQLALTNGSQERLLESLLELGPVHEAVVVNTCNRVEVVTCSDAGIDTRAVLAAELFRIRGMDPDKASNFLYDFRDRDAVRHVFRVASSLDSMVLGEPQILGQLKSQFDLSAELETAGPVLHRVFQKSFSVAKRVRSETGVASRTVSVASTAVELAERIFDSLQGNTVMLIGAGEMGETTARHLRGAGVGEVMVVNRTFETAVELARELGGTPIPMDRMAQYLPLADLVIGSVGGGELLDAAGAEAALRERRGRPAFFIDLAVPRNFSPAINDLEGAYLYDIDDLGSVVEENMDERRREARRAEAIVEAEVDSFWRWFEKLEVAPTIVELRDHAETIRTMELERTLARMPGLDARDRERLDAMTQAIVKRLLHQPTEALKLPGSKAEESRLVTAVRRLFGLEEKS